MKTLVSILLSSLILLSSSGISYAKHFCGPFEVIAKVTFGEESLSCGMVMESSPCDHEKEEKHSCCSNKYLKVNTDDHFNKTAFDFNLDSSWLFVASEVFQFDEVIILPQKTTVVNCYRPPPDTRDLNILYETFLI